MKTEYSMLKGEMVKNWSESEVEAAVEDDFLMFRLELTGKEFNETAHRWVKLEHRNISAVLIEMASS